VIQRARYISKICSLTRIYGFSCGVRAACKIAVEAIDNTFLRENRRNVLFDSIGDLRTLVAESAINVRLTFSVLVSHVEIVLEVVLQLLNRDVVKASPAEHLDRLFLTPHGAQADAVLRQRNSHAVHG
jgi:hypothetical protein